MRPFDVVLFGATGFTGGLTARALADRATTQRLRWAIADELVSAPHGVAAGPGVELPHVAELQAQLVAVDPPARLDRLGHEHLLAEEP